MTELLGVLPATENKLCMPRQEKVGQWFPETRIGKAVQDWM